jgi:hypothetical protein
MAALHSQLRNRLEAAVKQARRTAEAAAKVALERLTVGGVEPGSHLSVDERQLRNRLRAHGRQLGDQRDPKTGGQSINRLVHECAYEHWHRMLFARFLAENHLLIHEKEGMPVTLAECDELAVDEGAPDGWTLAARYAARMLPQIFRPNDPVLQVGLAPEHRRALEKFVTELPVEVFTAEDSLGWVYQFWQADRKDEVNASGDKITGETLPAVTQLFTEHYMVLFLLHNTIGAWWAAKLKSAGRIAKSDWDKCQNEHDCRKLVTLPGYEFTYLRFTKDEKGEWVPAAGAFPGWPKLLKDFKLLDPCCGSGHFLVAAFELLVRMRMQDENLFVKDACDAVLRENLHGLELDPRCTQIAAFALALTAWKFTEGFRSLPSLNIACSGSGVNAQREDWLALANGDTRLRSGLEQLYDLFQKAPELGSLIDPRRLANGDLMTASFAEIQPLLTEALQSEKAKRNDDLNEIGVAAQGMAQAADLLSRLYNFVLTNVPYLGRSKQNDTLRDYCDRAHPDAKADLANCFVERSLEFCTPGGSTGLVTPQNWLFQGAVKEMRLKMLRERLWNFATGLGPRAFQTPMWDFGVTLVSITRQPPSPSASMLALNVSDMPSPETKAAALAESAISALHQATQLRNPDGRLTWVEIRNDLPLLNQFADSYQGLRTGDIERFAHMFWELQQFGSDWVPLRRSTKSINPHDGIQMVLLWENARGQLHRNAAVMRDQLHDMHESGNKAWGRRGVALNQINLGTAFYSGHKFDFTVCVIIPKRDEWFLPIWAYCRSPDYEVQLRALDQRLSITNQTLLKVPFDVARWQRVVAEKYPNGLPEPDSNDPTQWFFNGGLARSTAPVQVGVARLLGYQWPRDIGETVSEAAPVADDGLEKFKDDDGIVCLPSVRGEPPAAERLRALLTAAHGEAWSSVKLDELLSAVNYAGSNLEDWLRNGLFDQHCKLFHHRPFIWHIWDGRKDGFSALVNYHKLDHKLLEKLTYTYLGDWIKKQQEAVANEESGADDRLLKAQQLQDKLKLILEGEAPYDIFVRWKPLDQQPIGWNPDLNDGVRLNIRPFMTANVLRKHPNIKWGVDRGKNPPGSPWGEVRDNDKHLTLEQKRAARKERGTL